MRNRRLCHIQCLRQITHTHLGTGQHTQNPDPGGIRKYLKKICQSSDLLLFRNLFLYLSDCITMRMYQITNAPLLIFSYSFSLPVPPKPVIPLLFLRHRLTFIIRKKQVRVNVLSVSIRKQSGRAFRLCRPAVISLILDLEFLDTECGLHSEYRSPPHRYPQTQPSTYWPDQADQIP